MPRVWLCSTPVRNDPSRSLRAVSEALTTAELADVTGRHPATIRRHCAAGVIAGAVKAGRDWTIPLPAAERYVAEYQPYQGLRKAPAGASTHPTGAPAEHPREHAGNERLPK